MSDVVSNFTALPNEACASEPIHIPGGIQPHGVLLCLDAADQVVQVSDNAERWLGAPVQTVLGSSLAEVIGEDAAAMIRAARRQRSVEGAPSYAGAIDRIGNVSLTEGPLAVVVHEHKGVTIVELEPAGGTVDVFASMYPLVRGFVNDLQAQESIAELCQLACDEIQRITGFGRTLVYRFDEQGHGHVLAEALESGYQSYLGQRFPASDIPSQARDLYRLNRIRLIADANYVAARLVPERNPQSGQPTDLTYASLRSVSPVHVQYMKNMGTLASMSMSIVVNGALWGLISCHHATPRLPPFEVRTACEHIAQILSLQVVAREAQAESTYRLQLRHTLSRLLASMADRDSFVDALAEDASLLDFTASSGAAIVFEGQTRLIGITPSEDEVDRLVSWLDARPAEVFATDHLVADCDVLEPTPDYAGFLAVSISKVFRNYVIWFRKEVVRTIDWAGDPRAKLVVLPSAHSPRKSFESWTETVRDRTLPWRRAEIEIATEFRTAILGIVLRRAEELAQLALELGRANKELEGFSYTVSHDLRAPLRHISGFAELIADIGGEQLPPRIKEYVGRIKTAASFGGELVDDLLAFSQLGRASLRPQEVDVHSLVIALVGEQQANSGNAQIDWKIGTLPSVQADPVFFQLALRSLIENAVKFSAKQPAPTIEIGGEELHERGRSFVRYFVRDNGVGFDMRYVDKLFGIFQRLHNDKQFPGTGIGLATVQRIAERHGGDVRAEGAVGKGAEISIMIPVEFKPEAGAKSETAAAAFARLASTDGRAWVQGIPKDNRSVKG
ncbi:GAF domain-containing protein [Caballeronia sp. LZ062]|uniref:ATP-binding protein n=1 Tax=unclassified Caballeronia TaxID=2646786 RepID=UPI00286780F3|nr:MULTISPECIES: ATP-binding protein [unclassified Caballeronia]MDR5856223.1 GAF domain-containing protein [Caballeronia sp. LZ050]MDR5872894.1 GAF domain-containing protein [Caballeronia sp. LZ062]